MAVGFNRKKPPVYFLEDLTDISSKDFYSHFNNVVIGKLNELLDPKSKTIIDLTSIAIDEGNLQDEYQNRVLTIIKRLIQERLGLIKRTTNESFQRRLFIDNGQDIFSHQFAQEWVESLDELNLGFLLWQVASIGHKDIAQLIIDYRKKDLNKDQLSAALTLARTQNHLSIADKIQALISEKQLLTI
jgi:hypothetical protein